MLLLNNYMFNIVLIHNKIIFVNNYFGRITKLEAGTKKHVSVGTPTRHAVRPGQKFLILSKYFTIANGGTVIWDNSADRAN